LRLQIPPPPPPDPGPSVTPSPSPPVPLYPIGDDSTRTGRNAGRPIGRYPFVVLGTRGPGNAPVTIAKYGSGSESDYATLQPLNPQYRFGQDAEFIGQALNVPWGWAPGLVGAGYDVRQDPGAVPPPTEARRFAPAPQGAPPAPLIAARPMTALPQGGTHAPHA
jgi:hypothetical protein